MLPRHNFTLKIFLIFLASARLLSAGIAGTATLGVQARTGFQNLGFGYNVSLYDKLDEQVLMGLQSGQGIASDASAVPVLAAAYVRLPMGSAIVPVATGGIGYAFSDTASGFLWRAGGLFDIRNGKHSSILLGAEYEGHGGYGGGIALRAGLLLEI